MSQRQRARYEFDGLPLSGVAPGTSLLVTGPGRDVSLLGRRLVLEGSDRDEGMVVVSTNDSGRAVVEACLDAEPDLATDRLCVVDASGSPDIETDTDAFLGEVSSSSDLTGVSIEFSICYSHLFGMDVRRIRACFDSVSVLTMYTSFQTVTRFVHAMTGRVSATDGLGLFVLDPSMHDGQVTSTLSHLCDGRLEVRRVGRGHELRVEGLADQPDEWTAVDL